MGFLKLFKRQKSAEFITLQKNLEIVNSSHYEVIEKR